MLYNWGIKSHTLKFELPIKILNNFTLYPSYRFYHQSEADYFKPYDQHLSSSSYYTSDYDLSKFKSNQVGLELNTWIFLRNWGSGL